jgi:hypothetical protein
MHELFERHFAINEEGFRFVVCSGGLAEAQAEKHHAKGVRKRSVRHGAEEVYMWSNSSRELSPNPKNATSVITAAFTGAAPPALAPPPLAPPLEPSAQ